MTRYISAWIMALTAAMTSAYCAESDDLVSGAGLPPDWSGMWSGACSTIYTDGKRLDYTMGLSIEPIQGRKASKWTITYTSSEMNQTRSYEIIAVDEEKGHFKIDEKNSILLDTYLIDTTLHSRFEIDGMNLESTYHLTASSIEVTMISSSTKPESSSGGEKGISDVISFEHISVQRGSLKRNN